jgi:hypothetical protein
VKGGQNGVIVSKVAIRWPIDRVHLTGVLNSVGLLCGYGRGVSYTVMVVRGHGGGGKNTCEKREKKKYMYLEVVP